MINKTELEQIKNLRRLIRKYNYSTRATRLFLRTLNFGSDLVKFKEEHERVYDSAILKLK